MAQNTFQLLLPSPNELGETTLVESNGSVVIVGANGSGKTRLGAWLELKTDQAHRVHRISAQKSLDMPEFSIATDVDFARRELLYGGPGEIGESLPYQYRRAHRWRGKPNTALLSDFQQLMVYLCSEEYEQSTKYRQAAKGTTDQIRPPETKLDIVKRIWETVLPHRKLVTSAGKVEVQPSNNTKTYNAAEMSDGERVIFYLVGQCLAAPEDAIIIIDEPESHLHKLIQARLWDAIEAERPDCLFVYMTHDLDFASTRTEAPKVWVKAYSKKGWDWSIIPRSDEVPENVFLQIVGGRKPVLFVEGDNNSLDQFLFSRLYPSYTVVPLSGCSNVIHATRSFASQRKLHSLECAGIVDRDYRSVTEIEYLRSIKVFPLEVAEVENLCLLEEVLQQVAIMLLHRDPSTIITSIKNLVFQEMRREKERIASTITAAAVEASFANFNAKAQGASALQASLNALINSIDITKLYTDAISKIDNIIDTLDYAEAIKVYSNKGLLNQASRFFGLRSPELIGYIKRLLDSNQSESLLKVMRQYVPSLPM